MTQLKYPNRPITKPQIKKIHTLKSMLGLSDYNYEALLSSLEVESSTELNRTKAGWLIETLTKWEDELEPKPNENDKHTLMHFNKAYIITSKQIEYIAHLWSEVSDMKTYESLMHFIKRVTGTLYIHIQSLSAAEIRKVINALKSWNMSQKKTLKTQR